jgi:oligogalacturonide lyase
MLRRFLGLALAAGLASAAPPPKTWVDPDTGHRVIQLTSEPGSASLYFNQNGYTADGRKLIYTTRDGVRALDLATYETQAVAEGRVRVIEAGRRTQRVYYIKEGAAWWTDVETRETRRIGELPPRASLSTVNADETLLAGTYVEGEGVAPYAPPPRQTQPGPQTLDQPPSKGQMMEQRFAARLPMAMFVLDVRSGERRVIHRANDWLNHLLFSPTDPALLMFCHEGPWHKVDRIWTIRTDGSALTRIHTRTMQMEIFGHEFWSADGKTIYYDLQTPRGEDFWLASYRVATGERTWLHLARNEWSIHFNVNRDETLYCGDGGDSGQVARAPDGRWLYLFRPERIPNRGVEDAKLIRAGVLRAEKLVNMAKHQYRLEPNVSFSPDQKWVVFRSNMLGETHVFAVEIARAAGR